MSEHLSMELREVNTAQRLVTGMVAPYDQTTFLVRDPLGERICRGAFDKSIRQRETRIPLCLNHDHSRAVGMSRSWTNDQAGLLGTFHVRESEQGDQVLADASDGYLPGMSIGFDALTAPRAKDGAREVREAKLLEVSLVLIGAYDGARVLAVRSVSTDELLAPFRNPPAVNLSPLVLPWG